MDKKTLQQIKEKLLKDKKNIEDEMKNIASKNIDKSTYSAVYREYGNEEGENAVEIADFDGNMALGKNLEKVLRDIEKTFVIIKKGKYGICNYCKTEIDKKRLLARPASTSCVRCKEKLTGTK